MYDARGSGAVGEDAELEQVGVPARADRVVLESRGRSTKPREKNGVWTGGIYQLELVKCGSKRCKACRARATHGPYWYKYARSLKGRLVSYYVGKEGSDAAKEAGLS